LSIALLHRFANEAKKDLKDPKQIFLSLLYRPLLQVQYVVYKYVLV